MLHERQGNGRQGPDAARERRREMKIEVSVPERGPEHAVAGCEIRGIPGEEGHLMFVTEGLQDPCGDQVPAAGRGNRPLDEQDPHPGILLARECEKGQLDRACLWTFPSRRK